MTSAHPAAPELAAPPRPKTAGAGAVLEASLGLGHRPSDWAGFGLALRVGSHTFGRGTPGRVESECDVIQKRVRISSWAQGRGNVQARPPSGSSGGRWSACLCLCRPPGRSPAGPQHLRVRVHARAGARCSPSHPLQWRAAFCKELFLQSGESRAGPLCMLV